ncbi:response regulator [Hyphococcus sp. DH-69]|uniref:response regulator n=1 Tax=Hyphococcus formosus TaxID=3143534 RepID=UPI00398AA173
MHNQPNTVMLVEDDDIDAIALEKAIELYSSDIKTMRATEGEDALKMLSNNRPDLILMDIRMPRMDGRTALSKIKSDDCLRSIPVVMMSTSESDEDIQFCYKNFANAYVVKPIGFDMSTKMVSNILNFWLKTAIQ